MRRRNFWGWGYEDQVVGAEFQRQLGAMLGSRLGVTDIVVTAPPTVDEIRLRAPRVAVPASLAALCSSDPYERLSHTYGKSYRDVIRALRRDFAPAPDIVAMPRTDADIVRLLDWCASANVAVIPYGGGSSVVGGIEPAVDDRYVGVASIDLRHLDKVLDVDRVSRAARIQGGVFGPVLEAQLKEHGLTLRHYPQSFEFSTLGGWIATRSGGHYATLYTHIDEFVEALRVITPRGVLETRRLPASGAGPNPDRLFIGSEGALGIITEAWMRVQERPTFRSSASVRFPTFFAGSRAVRALAQSGLHPANCRLLDPQEAQDSGVSDGAVAILLLGFESASGPTESAMLRALECCADHGGIYKPESVKHKQGGTERAEEADAWRNSFFRAPYLRDALAAMGFIVETFETAITWDRFESFHHAVMATAKDAMERICGNGGWVTCRLTHAYPDGVAPYYTIKAPGTKGEELEQWDQIKAAVSDALIKNGGTITHHHAVGRDHRRWYEQERPALFAEALVAAKAALDPRGILNPGVLVDARGG
ncbi:MAG: FAD-binding oxidoreductase [Sulfurifustaceae bacterium]